MRVVRRVLAALLPCLVLSEADAEKAAKYADEIWTEFLHAEAAAARVLGVSPSTEVPTP